MSKVRKDKVFLKWKRGVRSDTQISHRIVWRSNIGNYEVQQCTSKYEKTEEGKPVVYYYSLRANRILGRHIKKTAAYKSCEKSAKKWLTD